MSNLVIFRDGVGRVMTDAEQAVFLASLPTPAAPALPTITARQLRLALLGLGLTGAQVEAQISAMPGTPTSREAARIEWEYATSYQRGHQLVAMLGAALGMTSDQIDTAWVGAATL
jgi:hypothetical protein